MAELLKILKPISRLRAAGIPGAAYRRFTSVTTSIVILGITAFFYVIGTIFPQGASLDEYAKAGGKWLIFVDALSLLSLFSSPLFIIAALALLANLAICTYARYTGVFKSGWAASGEFTPQRAISLTQDLAAAHEEIRKVLKGPLGLKVVSKDSEWSVYSKGLPYRAITWVYHAAIAVCFIGLFLTYLFAYEDSAVFRRSRPDTVRPTANGLVQGLFTPKAGESPFSVILDEAAIEYAHAPALDYPKDKFSRLAVGLGWKAPAYSITEDSIAPTAYKARMKVIRDNKAVADEVVEVNSPLSYGGYTFYLEGIEDWIRVRMDNSPITLEAKEGEDLLVPGLDRPVRLTKLRTGKLRRLDGKVEEITPSVTVSVKGGADGAYDEVGAVKFGDYITVNGRRLTPASYEEGVSMSYRYDPGFPVLWWGGIVVLAALFLRFYASWYAFAYRVDESDGIVYVEVNVSARGVLADPEKMIARFETLLTRGDLKGIPIHSTHDGRRPS